MQKRAVEQCHARRLRLLRPVTRQGKRRAKLIAIRKGTGRIEHFPACIVEHPLAARHGHALRALDAGGLAFLYIAAGMPAGAVRPGNSFQREQGAPTDENSCQCCKHEVAHDQSLRPKHDSVK